MTDQDGNDTKPEDATSTMVLGWPAAMAAAIASVAGVASFALKEL